VMDASFVAISRARTRPASSSVSAQPLPTASISSVLHAACVCKVCDRVRKAITHACQPPDTARPDKRLLTMLTILTELTRHSPAGPAATLQPQDPAAADCSLPGSSSSCPARAPSRALPAARAGLRPGTKQRTTGPRVHAVFLVDTSAGMAGAPARAVAAGILATARGVLRPKDLLSVFTYGSAVEGVWQAVQVRSMQACATDDALSTLCTFSGTCAAAAGLPGVQPACCTPNRWASQAGRQPFRQAIACRRAAQARGNGICAGSGQSMGGTSSDADACTAVPLTTEACRHAAIVMVVLSTCMQPCSCRW
jgi:hypothetical protein